MGSLADSAGEVLGDFMRAAAVSGLECVVIGAGARVLWCRSLPNQEIDPGRLTGDWDLAVEVDDWDGFNQLIRNLTEGTDAPFQSTEVQHRLIHQATKRPLDIVPFGGLETEPGKITWSDSGTMNVTGFATTLKHRVVAEVDGLSIPFAHLQTQAVMKAIAYLDRRAGGKTHDVIDLVWVLRNYGEGDNEARIYDDIPDILIDHDVETYATGAVLLGHDLREFPADLLGPLREVLAELMTEWSSAVRDAHATAHSFAIMRADAEIHHLAQAVVWGLDH